MRVSQSPDLFASSDDNEFSNEKLNDDGIIENNLFAQNLIASDDEEENNAVSQNLLDSYDKGEDNTKNTEKENDNETVHEQVKIKKYHSNVQVHNSVRTNYSCI